MTLRWMMGAAIVAVLGVFGCGRGGSDRGGTEAESASKPVPPAGVVSFAQVTGESDGVPTYRTEYLSPVYTIDRIYKSMEGPVAMEAAMLIQSESPELLWITGYSVIVTAPDGEEPLSPEFMCHVNMNVDRKAYSQAFPTRMPPISSRLFSLDQGTMAVKFPKGFGIPIRSDVPVLLNTQVLNHHVVGKTFDVRQRLRIDFVRQRDLERPFKALTNRGVYGMVLVEGPDGNFMSDPAVSNPTLHGASCSLADDMGDRRGRVDDGMGRRFSSFWVVEPGKQVYHTRVTPILNLPYDTRVHFMSAHLHPFAETIELYDLTAKKTVHTLSATQADGRIGLDRVETWSDVEGLPLYKDHEYDLIATYDNTSGEKQDAMSVLFLYVEARDLEWVADSGERAPGRWRQIDPTAHDGLAARAAAGPGFSTP